jgi:hypothetical protein
MPLSTTRIQINATDLQSIASNLPNINYAPLTGGLIGRDEFFNGFYHNLIVGFEEDSFAFLTEGINRDEATQTTQPGEANTELRL